MRTIIIGDVHGCLTELQALISLVCPGSNDHLIFVGDLIHRGPDSPGVVRFVRAYLRSITKVTLIMGNHEEKHNRWRRRKAEGTEHRMKYTEEYPEIEAKLDAQDIEFLEGAALFHRLPEYESVVLHGGLLPDTELPEDPFDKLSGKQKKSAYKILRIRDVNPDAGSMVKLGEKTDEDVFWTDIYDGRHGHIYFGHHPFIGSRAPTQMRPYVSRPIGCVGERVETSKTVVATGMDLGCVFGGHLAAVILTPGKPQATLTIKALEKYSQEWQEED
jgi:hypothetical protein